MAPKGKAKGKAKPGTAEEQAGVSVPQPPPTPVLVKFPEVVTGRLAPTARCALLAWRDVAGSYSLQYRPFEGDTQKLRAEERWTDAESVQAHPIGSRADVFLVSGINTSRAEFRLVSKSGKEPVDGHYVANWFSAPSDPTAAFVDPPLGPVGTVVARGDHVPPSVLLRFSPSNGEEINRFEVSNLAMREEGVSEAGDIFQAWPGLAICRVQTRWRVVRHVGSTRDREMAQIDPPFGGGDGERVLGTPQEVTESNCPFDPVTGAWALSMPEVPHNLVLRVEVRIGTAYRWSAWSEESEDISVILAPPEPTGPVALIGLSDANLRTRWPRFRLAEGLRLCEYRVSVCQLGPPGKYDDIRELWVEGSARTVGLFISTANCHDDAIYHEISGLIPDMFYMVRVDARYPFVGDRGWCEPAFAEEVFHTSIAARPPPSAPVAVPLDEVLALAAAHPADAEDCVAEWQLPPVRDRWQWLALLVEKRLQGEYSLEFAPSAAPDRRIWAQPKEVVVLPISDALWTALGEVPGSMVEIEGCVPERAGAKKNTQTRISALLERKATEGALPWSHDERSTNRKPTLASATMRSGNALYDSTFGWSIVLALAPRFRLGDDSLVTRLRHKNPTSVPPHLAIGSVSSPFVAFLEPPEAPVAGVRFSRELSAFGLMVRFYLGTALPMKDAEEDLGEDKLGAHFDVLGTVVGLRRVAGAVERMQQSLDEGCQVSPEATCTRQVRDGHRLVTDLQIRVRRLVTEYEGKNATSNGDWRALAPVSLPPPLYRPSGRCVELPGVEREVRAEARQLSGAIDSGGSCSELNPAEGLVWDLGVRHEAWFSPSQHGLDDRSAYNLELRIGALGKWSSWVPVSGSVDFRLPPPRPPRNQQGHELPMKCTASSPTCVTLSFQPFVLLPGAPSLVEYLVIARPRFPEGTLASEIIDKTGAGDSAREGAGEVTKIVLAEGTTLRTEEELVETLTGGDRLGDIRDAAHLHTILLREGDEEIEALYNARGKSWVHINLGGLFPATVYEVSVSARYPRALLGILANAVVKGESEILAHGESDDVALRSTIELPCGDGPPDPPCVPEASKTGAANLSVSSRQVILEIDEGANNVVQCACVGQTEGWYPSHNKLHQARTGKYSANATAKWWANADATDILCDWVTVPTRRLEGVKTDKPSTVYVVADLPPFDAQGTADCPSNADLPDVVRFRLRAATRVGCHPGRWVSGATDAIPTCIAPITLPPVAKRSFQDKGWHLRVSFFVHSTTSPFLSSHSLPMTVGQVRDSVDAEELLAELMERGSPSDDIVLLQKNFETEVRGNTEDIDLEELFLFAPIGYGHTKVSWVQPRARAVGSAFSEDDPDREEPAAGGGWLTLTPTPLAQCSRDVLAFAKITPTRFVLGDLHALEISSGVLQEGFVYELQLRLGDGHRWSAWSISSPWFRFDVPKPQPRLLPSSFGGQQLEIETISASAVRCRWLPFIVPPGITKVSYELRAVLVGNDAPSPQKVASSSAVYVMPAPPMSGVGGSEADSPGALEAVLGNLLPATEYIFSVAAVYPYIGSRRVGRVLRSEPQTLQNRVADWIAPPAPAVLSCKGPTPCALANDGLHLFHPNERGFLVAFPDTAVLGSEISYCLEYRHVLCFPDEGPKTGDLLSLAMVDFRTSWSSPLEVVSGDDLLLQGLSRTSLTILTPQWKLPPRLWRVRLPPVSAIACGLEGQLPKAWVESQLQRVQFRLVTKQWDACPVTRWFSDASPPVCSAVAPPLAPACALRISDGHIGLRASFVLDRRLAPERLLLRQKDAENSRSGTLREVALNAWEAVERQSDEMTAPGKVVDASLDLPVGFAHAFVTHFQFRFRSSPRPAPSDTEDGRLPLGVKRPPPHGAPWSSWVECPDMGLQSAEGELDVQLQEAQLAVNLTAPGGGPLDYASWYQVAVRVSDGVAWSDWSATSKAVKIFVVSPKAERPDSDKLLVERSDMGSNVTLSWPLLRAHVGLRLIEYALTVSEVLSDGSELCARQTAAIIVGDASNFSEFHLRRREGDTVDGEDAHHPQDGRRAMMSHVIRDLRLDVTYVFTLSARYPHVGRRDFELALRSAPVSLRPARSPLPVPVQLPMPADRMRRLSGVRCVLMRWSSPGAAECSYHLQAAAVVVSEGQGARDDAWVPCVDVSRILVDGVNACLVKNIPGGALLYRFRLYEESTGRFGRASSPMLLWIEPVARLGVTLTITEACLRLLLRAPLGVGAPLGTHDLVCRYQVRYKADKVDAEWFEFPEKMLWHQHNGCPNAESPPVDDKGVVFSGLGPIDVHPVDTAHFAIEQHMPTLPLPIVGPTGNIGRQRCLVEVLSEDDGLLPEQTYVFAVRVGDMFGISEWCPQSEGVRISVPPPRLYSVGPDCIPPRLKLVAVTAHSFVVEWPRFLPAVDTGVPIHAAVEYLLDVFPQFCKRRLSGSDVANSEEVALGQPISQFFLCSVAPRGACLDDLVRTEGNGDATHNPLRVEVSGLANHTPYALRLSVRYARIGDRRWFETASSFVTTRKPDAFPPSGLAKGPQDPVAEDLAQRSSAPDAGDNTKVQQLRSSVAPSPRSESPRWLPPLSCGPTRHLTGAFGGTSSLGTREALLTGVGPATVSVSGPLVEEWMSITNAAADRVITGCYRKVLEAAIKGTIPAASNRDEDLSTYPHAVARPEDFVSFWRRDPTDARPPMPVMPEGSHQSAQSDCYGSKQPAVVWDEPPRQGARGESQRLQPAIVPPKGAGRAGIAAPRSARMSLGRAGIAEAYPRRSVRED